MEPLTIGQVVEYFAPGLKTPDGPPDWPPDAFALATAILQKSGAYCAVVEKWPLDPLEPLDDPKLAAKAWVDRVRAVARQWRDSAAIEDPPPARVVALWEFIWHRRAVSLADVRKSAELPNALLELCAIADEACAGGGAPNRADPDQFDTMLDLHFWANNTLCKHVDTSRAYVYPKLHTPQSGLTIRSLSHHMAFFEAGEVVPRWHRLAAVPPKEAMNVLVIPWPRVVHPRQFTGVSGSLDNMPDHYGFFTYEPEKLQAKDLEELGEIIHLAADRVGKVDIVVFPESAFLDDDYEEVRRVVCGAENCMLIAGTTKHASAGLENVARVAFPASSGVPQLPPQHKHHRWQIDRGQVLQYGLGRQLDPGKKWWEKISVPSREIAFLPLAHWLTLAVLICEDLARQDPVAQLVRAVGPNLVIALLLDGPQLAARWPARYATVLADDPGSSVLTVTSLGMCELSRPAGMPPSRTIALWKDARSGGAREISLPDKARAVVLCLANEPTEDWTADGRGDGKTTYYPILAGVHPV